MRSVWVLCRQEVDKCVCMHEASTPSVCKPCTQAVLQVHKLCGTRLCPPVPCAL